MIELSRSQDEEVGDGTTSVIVLGESYDRLFTTLILREHVYEWKSKRMNVAIAGEMLHVAESFIDKAYHPTVICRGNFYCNALT